MDSQVFVDGFDEFGDGIECSSSDRLVRDFCEKFLDEVEPRARCGHEVQVESLVLS
jgi:hypothetical protein